MLRYLIAASVISAVFCQPNPKPCCTPDKWEGIQAGQGGFVSEGKPEVLSVISYIAFDRSNKRVFAYTNTTAGTTSLSQEVFQDFNKKVQYVLDVKTGICVKSRISSPFNNGCLPENAKYMGMYTIGLGKESLHAKSYTVHIADELGNVLDVSVSVTSDLCVPVGENAVGSQNKVPLAVTYGFVNITPGIKDPSIFNPPAACLKNATNAEYLPQVHQHRHALF